MLERIQEVVAEQLSVKKEDVTSEKRFVEDLGADSLDTVELVMALEEEFDVQIPDDISAELTSVQSVVDFLEKK